MKVISCSSLFLSIIAIILYLSDLKYSDVANTSILVAVLAILVTLLVAWQIYNAYVSKEDMNNLRRDFENFRNEMIGRVEEAERNLAQRQNDGLVLLRDISFRNMDAITTCMLLRDNKGEAAVLEFIIDNVEKAENGDDGGFFRHSLYEWAEACVSDIVSALMYDKDGTPLGNCIETIPHDKFCRLYSLRLSEDGWDAHRITQFKYWLDIISSRYPAPVTPEPDKE